jgi:hypothetical protein
VQSNDAKSCVQHPGYYNYQMQELTLKFVLLSSSQKPTISNAIKAQLYNNTITGKRDTLKTELSNTSQNRNDRHEMDDNSTIE